MSILALKSKEVDDIDGRYGAYANAVIRTMEAKEKFPSLVSASHISDVADVKSEVIGFTDFETKQTSRSSNIYENARYQVAGEINGPATTLKLNFANQRNFTAKDGQDLHAHLKSVLPHLKINVLFDGRKPVCVVHIGT